MAPPARILTLVQAGNGAAPGAPVASTMEGLIKIRAPGELIRAVGNIRHTQGGVAVELPFDRQVPLDAVRVFLVPLIRSEECLRTKRC